jgi:hypothetical protein
MLHNEELSLKAFFEHVMLMLLTGITFVFFRKVSIVFEVNIKGRVLSVEEYLSARVRNMTDIYHCT